MTTPFIFSKSIKIEIDIPSCLDSYLNFAMYSKSGVSLPFEVMVAPATTLPILSCKNIVNWKKIPLKKPESFPSNVRKKSYMTKRNFLKIGNVRKMFKRIEEPVYNFAPVPSKFVFF